MASPWALVALSLLVLALAPLLALGLQRRPALAAGLDSFVLVSVSVVVLLHVVPHSAEVLGAPAVLAAGAGLLLPIALHKLDHALGGEARRGLRLTRDRIVYTLLALGLTVHALFDGAALSAHSQSLALGVLAHRLPAGLALWVMLRPRAGTARTLTLMGLYGGGTVVGALVGGALEASAGARPLALLQAIVAGSILHVVAESPPLGSTRTLGGRLAGMVGAALAALALALVTHEEGLAPGVLDGALAFALAAAPALVAAFLLVGLLSAFYPEGAPRLSARGARLQDAAVGTAVGLVHPLCACKVDPLFESLVKRGASLSSAGAFLVAAPALGVPAALLSLRFFALPFVLARVLTAALLALLAGVTARTEGGAAMAAAEPAPTSKEPVRQRLWHGLRHAFVDGVDHVGPWLVVGLFAAGALSASLPPGWLTALPTVWHPLLCALLAFPLYLCAAGLTPVAAALLALGLSPGGALALLLVGPATSVASLARVKERAGARTALVLGAVVLGGAALAGHALDLATDLVTGLALKAAPGVSGTLAVPPLLPRLPDATALGALDGAALLVMLALGVASLWRQGVRGALVQVMSPQHQHVDDHAHGAGCVHDHGPPLAPSVPMGFVEGAVAKGPVRVRLSFDPRNPSAPKDPAG